MDFLQLAEEFYRAYDDLPSCPPPKDGGRPQHVAAGGQASIPAIDDELCLEARGSVRLELGGAGLDVETSCPDAHRASIEPLSYCIAKTAFGIIPWMPFVPSTTWVT
jgi:hypothetical protein